MQRRRACKRLARTKEVQRLPRVIPPDCVTFATITATSVLRWGAFARPTAAGKCHQRQQAAAHQRQRRRFRHGGRRVEDGGKGADLLLPA